MNVNRVSGSIWLLTAALLLLPRIAAAADATAFALAKEGNRYIGEQAKDKVVQIRSEKSVGGLTPTVWFVVYHDPTATFKSVEVKFGGGKMLDVKRPLRMLEPVTGGDQPLPADKLKIDSDKALKVATAEPILEKVTLKAAQLKLERWSEMPVWKIRLWAARASNPNKQVDIGEIFVGAEDGKVLKTDIRIDRVN